MLARLSYRSIARGGSRLEGGGGLVEGFIVRVVAKLVGLGKALVARRGGTISGHVWRLEVSILLVLASHTIQAICRGRVGASRGFSSEIEGFVAKRIRGPRAMPAAHQRATRKLQKMTRLPKTT